MLIIFTLLISILISLLIGLLAIFVIYSYVKSVDNKLNYLIKSLDEKLKSLDENLKSISIITTTQPAEEANEYAAEKQLLLEQIQLLLNKLEKRDKGWRSYIERIKTKYRDRFARRDHIYNQNVERLKAHNSRLQVQLNT